MCFLLKKGDKKVHPKTQDSFLSIPFAHYKIWCNWQDLAGVLSTVNAFTYIGLSPLLLHQGLHQIMIPFFIPWDKSTSSFITAPCLLILSHWNHTIPTLQVAGFDAKPCDGCHCPCEVLHHGMYLGNYSPGYSLMLYCLFPPLFFLFLY